MSLNDASEGEEEPEHIFSNARKQETSTARESRKDREDKLKKMMEDDGKDLRCDIRYVGHHY